MISRLAVRFRRPLFSSLATRNLVTPTAVLNLGLPYHIVVGLPALSPTMETGNLAEWYVKEGDSISAGDAIAQIETDKASMDFEAQDDAVIAKILVQPGGGDLAVGTPIMVTVEEEDDVAAFANFESPTVEASAAAPAEAVEEPAPVEATPPPPAPAGQATPPPPPVPVSASVPRSPTVEAPVASTAASTATPSVVWGQQASIASPLAKTLAKDQASYIEKYGTTGQKPIA